MGNVINALVESSKGKGNTFIPYRNSKLTRVLQESLVLSIIILCTYIFIDIIAFSFEGWQHYLLQHAISTSLSLYVEICESRESHQQGTENLYYLPGYIVDVEDLFKILLNDIIQQYFIYTPKYNNRLAYYLL